MFWNTLEKYPCDVNDISFSKIGTVVREAVEQIDSHYENVTVDKFCIMPDHVHIILFVLPIESGRQVAAPSVSAVIGQMKRWVSMQIGISVWQKSFMDHIIRNEKDYQEIWKYIDRNPRKLILDSKLKNLN